VLFKDINFPEEILRAREAGELVIFAGAGISMPPPSLLPSFPELARKIGQDSGIEFESGEPEDHYLGRLRKRGVHVHEISANILVNDATKPHDLHQLLFELFASHEQLRIVTTNFDVHFLTAAHQLAVHPFDVFYAPALPIGDDFAGLVYLHGCAGKNPMSCVLTDEDFGRAYLTQGWASRFLSAMFSRYTVLFVGYSHDDTVMNYLARGLPPVRQKSRFAFTVDDKPSLSKWEFLDITPLTYKLCSGDNAHQAITDNVAELVRYVRQDLLQKGQRIRELVTTHPPLDGPDADYLKFSLSKLDTARIFLKHARSPEWIGWLEAQGSLEPLFDRRAKLEEIDRELAMWVAENFLVDNKALLSAIFRNGGQLNAELCRIICWRLSNREHIPSIAGVFSRWTALLLSQPRDMLTDYDWSSLLRHCHLPDDAKVAVLLFDLLTRPRLILNEQIGFVGEDVTKEVGCELNLFRNRDMWIADAWNNVLRPTCL